MNKLGRRDSRVEMRKTGEEIEVTITGGRAKSWKGRCERMVTVGRSAAEASCVYLKRYLPLMLSRRGSLQPEEVLGYCALCDDYAIWKSPAKVYPAVKVTPSSTCCWDLPDLLGLQLITNGLLNQAEYVSGRKLWFGTALELVKLSDAMVWCCRCRSACMKLLFLVLEFGHHVQEIAAAVTLVLGLETSRIGHYTPNYFEVDESER